MSSHTGHVTTETVYGQTLALWLGNGDEYHALESDTTGLNVKRNLYLSVMEKIGKTTGLVRYKLNQITYECTMEVKNRFKELDLVDKVLEELWMEVRNIVQEAATKNHPKE